MRHGSQRPVATPEPAPTRDTGVPSRTNACPNGLSAADCSVCNDPGEGTSIQYSQAVYALGAVACVFSHFSSDSLEARGLVLSMKGRLLD